MQMLKAHFMALLNNRIIQIAKNNPDLTSAVKLFKQKARKHRQVRYKETFNFWLTRPNWTGRQTLKFNFGD